MRYRREVDGLRAVAVIAVILFHAGLPEFSGGYVGVDVFFVISGYLITSLILAEHQAGTFTLVRFYERRARRILPVLFFVVLLCVPVAWEWMLPKDLKAFSASLLSVPAFSSNILFWREAGLSGDYFDATEGMRTLLHTWSLAVEEQYYLLFPPLLLLMWRFGWRWRFVAFGVLGICSLELAHWSTAHHPTSGFYLLPTRGWELLIGVFIAFLLHDHRSDMTAGGGAVKESTVKAGALRESAAIAGLLLIAYAVFEFDENVPFPGFHALVPTIGTALVILSATPATRVGALLGSRPLVGIGLVSYSAYLWHEPLFSFARLRSFMPPSVPLLLFLALAAFGLSFLTWKYIEQPFRNPKRVTRRTLVCACLFGAVCILGAGLAGYLTGGLPQRLGSWESTWKDIAATKEPGQSFCELHRRTVEQLARGDLCIEGHAARPSFAVIGDSHAAAIFEELAASPLMASRSFYAVTGHWCAPLGNGFRMPDLGDADCQETTQVALAHIADFPSVDTVVLAAEWANYTQGYRNNGRGGWSRPVLCEDREGRSTSPADNEVVVRRALQATINLLKAHGKRVIVIGPAPEFKERVLEYVAKRAFFTRSRDLKAIAPRIPVAEYEQRTAEVADVFREVHGAEFVMPRDLFCGTKSCNSIDSAGDILFADTNHVTNYGARLIVRELERVIAEPQRPLSARR